MGKIVLFWLIGVLSLVILFGGGGYYFFWLFRKGKKEKLW